MSEAAALPQPAATWQSSLLRIPRRPFKLFAAITLLGAGAWGVLSEREYVASSNAIVSAYVLDIRTPIEGVIDGLPGAPGQPVATGALLGKVENPLADRQHLDNLRTLEDVADSTAAADAQEITALEAQRRILLIRAQAHSTAVATRLGHAVEESRSDLAARTADAAQAAADLSRGVRLHDGGILADSDYERLLTADALARRRLDAQRASLAAVQDEHAAALSGLLTEPGTNSDVAYSRQRADELAIRIGETRRSLAASRAQALQAHAAVEDEAARYARMHTTTLRSPVAGQVWQTIAIDGEHTAAGEPVVSLVECAQQFLLVEIPQERLPDVALGQRARIRFTGESAEHSGLVLAAFGDPQKEANHKLAAYPVQDTSLQLATVRVTLDPGPCIVGRTAAVLVPTLPTSPLGRLLRRYF